jgi:hypothetical protein
VDSAWQRAGASFELVELEVTAGDDVAFAWALLRCGTAAEFRGDPDNYLRLFSPQAGRSSFFSMTRGTDSVR